MSNTRKKPCEYSEEDRTNAGKPTLSEFIEMLLLMKEKYGSDTVIVGAYDGNWNEDVYIQVLGDRIIVGSIN